jgi:ankyrin repeat protein
MTFLPADAAPAASGQAESGKAYSHATVLVGHGFDFMHEELRDLLKSEPIKTNFLGDGRVGLSCNLLRNQPHMPNGASVSLFHGNVTPVLGVHHQEVGASGNPADLVPTVEMARLLYLKGIRDMTFFSCHIGMAANQILHRINLDPLWPKPVDPSLRITLVGGKKATLSSLNESDMRNRLFDYVDVGQGRNEPGADGRLEQQTVSSMEVLTFNQATGRMEKTHRGPPRMTKEQLEKMSAEDVIIARGNLFLKRALMGDLKKIQAMVENATLSRTLLDYKGTHGHTAIQLAAGEGAVEVVQWLLTQQEDALNRGDARGTTLLAAASAWGRTDVVEMLLQYADIGVNHADRRGMTPLCVAAHRGHKGAVDALLKHKAVDVNHVSVLGKPLELAVESGQADVVESLLESREIDLSAEAGKPSPFYRAIEMGNEAIVNLFPGRAGVDVNQADVSGFTPLGWAARTGRKDMVDLLLRRKGTELHGTSNGLLPVEIAMQNGHADIVGLLLWLEPLASNGETLRYGAACLNWAILRGNTEIIKLLLERGYANVNDPDLHGVPPVCLAVESGRADVLKVLLESPGLNVDQETPRWETALYAAAVRGEQGMVEMLLGRGAGVECGVGNIIDAAAAFGHTEIAEMIEAKIAKSPPPV